MSDLIERLRDMEESWADAIKRMDSNPEVSGGIMTSIRFEQHDTLKKAADEIESLRAKVAELEAKLDAVMLEHCPDEMTLEQVENWGKHQAKHEAVEPVAVINVEARTLEWNGPVDWMTPETAKLNKIPLYTHPPKVEAVEPLSVEAWIDLMPEMYESIIMASREQALRKAAEVAKHWMEHTYDDSWLNEAILALPHDDSHLRELMMRVAEEVCNFWDINGYDPDHKYIVDSVLKGETK